MPEAAFKLSGQVGPAEVTKTWEASQPALKRGEFPERVDLSAITRADSSIIALLLEWQAQARAKNRSIEFAHPPEGLRVLARLGDVHTLLGWHGSDHKDKA